MFDDCDALINLTISECVTNVGDYVFADCDKLIYVIQDNGRATEDGSSNTGNIGQYMYMNDIKLQHVYYTKSNVASNLTKDNYYTEQEIIGKRLVLGFNDNNFCYWSISL